MSIEELNKVVEQRLKRDDLDWLFEDKLKLWVADDGCLSASFNDELIPCEGRDWPDALQVIADYIIERRP